MANSTRTITTLIALLISGGMMTLAYFLPSLLTVQTVDAESTREILEAYAEKDTDDDGLFDWQESLYATDPNNPESVRAGMKDGEAVQQGLVEPKFSSETAAPIPDVDVNTLPGTTPTSGSLTDQFAREFFTDYISGRGATPPTEDEMIAFATGAVSEFGSRVSFSDVYTSRDVNVSGAGPEALRAYAARVDEVSQAYATNSRISETEYLSDAVHKNDMAALDQVRKIGATYTGLARAYVRVPVPQEATQAHLELANTLARMGVVITNMAELKDDPLRSLVGLNQYEPTTQELLRDLKAIDTVFVNADVTIAPGESGYVFYNLAASPRGQGTQ